MKKYRVEIFDFLEMSFGKVLHLMMKVSLQNLGMVNIMEDVEPDVYIWKIEAQFKDDSYWEGQTFRRRKI